MRGSACVTVYGLMARARLRWLTDSWKEVQDCLADVVRFDDGAGDERVGVQVEYFCALVHGQLLDVLFVAVEVSFWWREVNSCGIELVVALHDSGGVEVLQENQDQPSVFGVRDSSSVVGLRDHIVQSFPRNFFVLVQEHLELRIADREVCEREFVGDVPPQRAEDSALQDQRVEEREPEEQLFPLVGLVADLEGLRVLAGESTVQVVLDAPRRPARFTKSQ